MGLQKIGAHKVGAGTFDAVVIEKTITVAGDSNFDEGTLFVDDSTNRVGLGTTGPGAQLDVHDTTTGSANTGGHVRLSANDGAAMGDSHRLGVIEFTGAEDGSGTQVVGARIEALTDAAWTNAENGAALYFYTTDGNASQTNVLKLDSNEKATFSGNVAVSGGLTSTAAANTLGTTTTINSLGTSATTLPGIYASEADGTGRVMKYLNDTIVAGDVYYLADDPAWEKCQADDAADGGPGDLLGVALGTNSNTDGLLLEGFVRINSGSYTGTAAVGKVAYMCETTAGQVNFDAPAASGEIVRTLGHCIQKDGSNHILFYFKPSNDYIELA